MPATVIDLLQRSFDKRSDDEKLQIVLGGTPRPEKFESDLFEKEQWLTACDVAKAYFCWPCLLFVPGSANKESRFRTDSFNSEQLLAAFEQHKNTTKHIDGVLKLRLFLDQRFPRPSVRNKVNELVSKNREVVKCIVDVVCHMATVKTPVSNGRSTSDQRLFEDCIEYLGTLKAVDFHNSPDEAIKQMEACPTILTHVVSTLTNLIAAEIKNEVQTSSFVSLICSEHSETDLKAKVSYVLRYVKDGKVLERFIEFNNCIVNKSQNAMESNISGILEKFEIGDKLLWFSCDGSVLSTKSLKNVLQSLKSKLPILLFVPCYYHDFDFVLEQTLSDFKECRLFFHTLRAIKGYIQGTSKLRQEFNSFMSDKVPNISDFKLSDSHFLNVLRLHRQDFINFFKDIEMNFRVYSVDDVARASGFATILTELETIFLLESFHVLFQRTAVFSETLSSCYPENIFDKDIIENLKTWFQEQGDEDFVRVWALTEPRLPATSEAEQCKQRSNCQQLYYQTFTHVASEIEIRLVDLETLNFFHVLNSDCQGKFIAYDEHLQNLVEHYGKWINKTSLKNELNMINLHDSGLLGKSVHQLLELLVSMELQNVCENVLNLAKLILSVPCKPIDPTGGASTKYDRIKAWSTALGDGGMLNDFSVLAVENDFLLHVKSQAKFCDEFMNAFQKLDNSLQVT